MVECHSGDDLKGVADSGVSVRLDLGTSLSVSHILILGVFLLAVFFLHLGHAGLGTGSLGRCLGHLGWGGGARRCLLGRCLGSNGLGTDAKLSLDLAKANLNIQ